MTSLDFDWEYLTRKRPFKWQQVSLSENLLALELTLFGCAMLKTFYFLARYTFLSTMITL